MLKKQRELHKEKSPLLEGKKQSLSKDTKDNQNVVEVVEKTQKSGEIEFNQNKENIIKIKSK